MENQNKLIRDAAKQILKPIGLFQKGNSRVWIDDQGWYCIQIEFQPSAYDKGAYLNVGVGFLWESTKALNESISFSFGHREKSHVKYVDNDIDFSSKMVEYANHAKESVVQYRKFSNLDYAKAQLEENIKRKAETLLFWEYYDLAMICFMSEKLLEGKIFLENFLKICKDNPRHIDWLSDLYVHCSNHLLPLCSDIKSAKQMVFDMIGR